MRQKERICVFYKIENYKKIYCFFLPVFCDIMSRREKQAAAKQTFVFLGSLTSKISL